MFLELGPDFYLKAQYCFGRAIKLNRKDVEAIADRAHVQSLWGKIDKAIAGYEAILRLSPQQPEQFLLRLADDCLREARFWEKGMGALSEVLCRVMGALFVQKQIGFLPIRPKAERYVPNRKMEVGYEASSVLVRHLMGLKRYGDAASVVQALHLFIAKLRERQTRFDVESEKQQELALPLDLVVRYGICQLYLDKLASALQCFAALRQMETSGSAGEEGQGEVVELLEEVAKAYMDTGKFFRALEILRRLDGSKSTSGSSSSTTSSSGLSEIARLRVKLQMARSYLALNQFKGAATTLAQIEAICTVAAAGFAPAAPASGPAAAAAAAVTTAVMSAAAQIAQGGGRKGGREEGGCTGTCNGRLWCCRRRRQEG